MKRRLVLAVIVLPLILAAVAVFFLNKHFIFSSPVGENSCRAVTVINSETGERITGIEDVAVDYENSLVYVSAHDRFAVKAALAEGRPPPQGGVYQIAFSALNTNGDTIKATPLFSDSYVSLDFRPHGLGLYHEEGITTLFVVNWRYGVVEGDWQETPVIEKFVLGGEVSGHVGTIRQSNLCSPNDIAPISADSFFVTNDHGACSRVGQFFEDVFNLNNAQLLFYNGTRFQTMLSGLAYANGVAFSRTDQNLYVSTTRNDSVYRYAVASDGGQSAALFPAGVYELPGAPDNITLNADGEPLVAYFPNVYRFAAYRGGWFDISAVSAGVARLEGEQDTTTAMRIFESHSSELTGATVAFEVDGKLIITSGFDDHFLVCGQGI